VIGCREALVVARLFIWRATRQVTGSHYVIMPPLRFCSERADPRVSKAPFLMTWGASRIESIMTSQPDMSPSIAEVCASVRRLGYGVSQSIRLYGEEFEVVSDPFPEAGGVAVSVSAKKNDGIRVLHLPATVLQNVQGRSVA
jgi:hypothetical protein